MLFQKGHTINVGKKWVGKKWTEEQKLRHRKVMKEITNRDDVKLKISQARTGKKFTEKHKENLRLSHLGNPGYWTGKIRINMKGKTWEEMYGKEKSIILKEKHRLFLEKHKFKFRRLGKPWNKGLTKETDKRIARFAVNITGEKNWRYGKKEDRKHVDFRISKVLSKVCQRPNNFEKECGKQLEKQFLGKFKYCGNGSVMINGKSPDYISEELKTVILCNGLYWHLWRFGLKDTPEDKQKIELRESEPFRKAGYEVWFIWENCHNRNPIGNYINKKLFEVEN